VGEEVRQLLRRRELPVEVALEELVVVLDDRSSGTGPSMRSPSCSSTAVSCSRSMMLSNSSWMPVGMWTGASGLPYRARRSSTQAW
jgi:hypothetical protein